MNWFKKKRMENRQIDSLLASDIVNLEHIQQIRLISRPYMEKGDFNFPPVGSALYDADLTDIRTMPTAIEGAQDERLYICFYQKDSEFYRARAYIRGASPQGQRWLRIPRTIALKEMGLYAE